MFKTTIGLEIHVELKTKTKIFCSCENVFGGEPNSHCCPICSGFPGVMPVLNKQAVDYTIRAGLALNCEISSYSKWDRKNYFYPDLPKAWQTSQYDLPLCKGGFVEIETEKGKKKIRLNRIHLEEDAGKLIHESGVTRVDYNRCGVPLMEIVTEPDLSSADEVIAFLEELKSILKYTGVSDVKMQEGSMRCDVNLSVSETDELGTRTETKNLNSFSSCRRSILYETERQIELISSGGKVRQETRRWDDAAGVGSSMRGKEDAHDYRYFPEPDLLPVVYSSEDVEKIRAEIPELKSARRLRYLNEFNLPKLDVDVLTGDCLIASLFDETVKIFNNPKKVSNYIMSEILRKGKSALSEDVEIGVTPSQLAEILTLVGDGVVSLVATKDILDYIWKTDISPSAAVEKLGLKQNNDTGEIEKLVDDIIAANEKVVLDFKAGNEKALAFFVGQVMKATKGKGNPKIVNEILNKKLK